MSNASKYEQIIWQDYLKVETDLNAIAKVVHWFQQFRKPPITDECWLQGQVALIEGFTNAVRHAHEHLPLETPIELRVKVSSNQLEIKIWDEGSEFNLDELLNSVPELVCPSDRTAHWGSVLLHKLRDQHHWHIHYACPDSSSSFQNCLTIQKRF